MSNIIEGLAGVHRLTLACDWPSHKRLDAELRIEGDDSSVWYVVYRGEHTQFETQSLPRALKAYDLGECRMTIDDILNL